jgi:peptide/nickel transport system ATP-binding protein
MPLLEVRDLRIAFPAAAGEVYAVDGVSFALDTGATLGLVGESGCGKTMTALSLLRLVPEPGRIAAGEILFDGRDLRALRAAEMRALRGDEIAMIFQEPTASLNPLFTVGDQIAETVRRHEKVGRRTARERAVEMLHRVEIPEPERRADAYPHEISGGMRQRVMIAMALSCGPRLLIADEPTTALDVTIQAQILDLLAGLQARLGMALLLVTHDLGVVAERSNEVAVMYAGRIVECGPVADVFAAPLHPYTRGLLHSIPHPGRDGQRRLTAIPGTVPALGQLPSGCRFRDRCPLAVAACAAQDPPLLAHRPAHFAACIRIGDPLVQTEPDGPSASTRG